MNLSLLIHRFLADGFYAEGVRLLEQCPGIPVGQVAFFKSYLGRAFVPTEVETRLSALLRGLIPEEETGETPPDPLKGEPQGDDPDGGPMGGQVRVKGAVSGSFWGPLFQGKQEVPEKVWQLYRRAVELHKRQSLLHAQMTEAAKAGKQKEAYKLAEELMEEVIPSLDAIYAAARAWGETGKVPEPVERNEAAEEAVTSLKRKQYLIQRRSRIRKWLEEGLHPRKKQGKTSQVKISPVELQGYEVELLEIEVELRNLDE